MLCVCRNKTIFVCYPFPNITHVDTYTRYNVALKALIYYIIPLCIIACFYVLMAIRLHASANNMPGEVRGAQSVAQANARRHVARMVLIFVFRKYNNSTLHTFYHSNDKFRSYLSCRVKTDFRNAIFGGIL